jgi:phosphoglycerate dehydrogenase-like enzyme
VAAHLCALPNSGAGPQVARVDWVPVLCLPSDLSDLLDAEPLRDVQAIVWDGAVPAPDGVANTEFWVPGYMSSDTSRRDTALAAMPGVKVIQLLSAGVEPWLPVVPPGATLCSGRGIHGVTTAELAVAGLLAMVRQLPRFLEQQAHGEWRRADTQSLAGRRVLIVGAGDIGEHVAAAVRVFDAEVSFVARTARDGVHSLDELPELLPRHDVVVIAVPLTDGTRGLVDAAFLAALPDGAIVVNVARGAIVVTDALVAELQSGRLRACLDVTDPEPLPAGHPLWSAPNVLITPHVGGGTPGWQVRARRLVRAQVERYLAGQPLVNVVENGY